MLSHVISPWAIAFAFRLTSDATRRSVQHFSRSSPGILPPLMSLPFSSLGEGIAEGDGIESVVPVKRILRCDFRLSAKGACGVTSARCPFADPPKE
jgi:hypothetical protein